MTLERAEKNFNFWKTLVNLPHYFPKLPPVPLEEVSSLMVITPENERQIMNSLFSKPLTLVVVPEGSGLTTLYQYVLEKFRDKSFDRLIIPVQIDLEEKKGGRKKKDKKEIDHEFLEQQIKKQVLGNLIENPWDSVLAEEHFYYCINFLQDREFDVYRAEMLDTLFGKKKKAWGTLCRSFPFLKKPLDEFLNYLLENLRIQTMLFFHIPRHNMNEEEILALVSSLKIIYEKYSIKSAALREVYFVNQSIQIDLNREYKRDYHVISCPRMTAAEIFAMMNKRFRPSLPGNMGRKDRIDLGNIFSEDFIKLSWQESRGINEVIDESRILILGQMDCERKEIPYRLIPTPEQLEKKTTTKSGDETTKPVKFTRRRKH